MSKLLDSFWRAAMYCLHPRVIALSVLPLVIMAVISLGVGYFFWESAVMAVRSGLESYELVNTVVRWLDTLGLGNLRLVLAPAVLLFLSIPVIVIATLLFVALFMTPAMVALVAERRFAQLERKKGGSFLASLFWSLGSTLLAVVALVVSIPLWLIPPLILVLPPLIWASGAMFIAMAPILVPVAIWIYTLVFAFSSLWFAHYTLAALEQLRKKNNALATDPLAQNAIKSIANEAAPETLSGPAARPGAFGGPP
ncbi:MAG: EI24 domain-containing protein [Polaromonas sp.]